MMARMESHSMRKFRFIVLLLSICFMASPTSATAKIECLCLCQMIYDVTTANSWQSVTIVFTDEEEVLTPRCIITSRLLQRLWKLDVKVNALYYSSSLQTYDIRHHSNVVTVYNNSTAHLLIEANERGDLLVPSWLLITPPESKREIIRQVEDFDVFIDSSILVAAFTHCEAEVKSPYRVGPKGRVIVEDIGTWNSTRGYQVHSTLGHYDRRADFKEYPIHGTGVKVFEFFTTYLKNNRVSGYVGDLVTTLQRTHNFSLTYQTLEGYSYGSLVDPVSNKWNGMVGELQERRADLTVSELSVTQERSEIITYTQPIHMISRKLFVATKEDFQKKLMAYALPMESILYVAVFFTMIVLVIFLVIAERIYSHYFPREMEGMYRAGISDASWCMVSALLQQGSDKQPVSAASRAIFWLGYFLSVIVYTSYSATLVSHLAVERPASLPFSNLLELSLQPDWNAGCNENDLFQVTASQTCLNSKTEECRVLRKVWNNNFMRKPDNLVSSYTEGLQKVLKGKYVFIGVGVTTNNYIRQLDSQDACNVKELPGSYLTGGIAIGLQPSSPFKIIFDRSLQKMRENGLMDKLGLKYLSAKRLCSSSTSVSAKLLDVAALFLMLLAGIGFSVLFLIGEVTIKRILQPPAGTGNMVRLES
ncbi:glutamate receptor 1-like isoform X2 [Macrobrachium rosenbergii]|uniref:glutamate receptor 1-like isoform X2 n=1 Tax=Macrobrachium rosenbergii TaxID=79674 RepID=UPI0034D7B1B7